MAVRTGIGRLPQLEDGIHEELENSRRSRTGRGAARELVPVRGRRLARGRDMMLNVGLRTKRNRRIVPALALTLRRGTPGALRLMNNVVKTLIALSERPATAA